MSHTTITRHQEDKLSKATSSLFPIKIIAKLEGTLTCLKRQLKKNTKIGFKDQLSLNAGQKYCRMLQESILQYFRTSLSYHLSLRPFIFEWPLKTGFTVFVLLLAYIKYGSGRML